MFYLGIDLAKASFDATLLSPDLPPQHLTFSNSPAGFAQLQTWLTQHAVRQLHAAMEATNVYWEALAAWLYAHNYTVSVVNPARIKGYAQAKMQRNKTDKLDSALIAAFCAGEQPEAWKPLSDEQRRLRALVRHRDDLLQTRLQQQNRLSDSSDSLVRRSLEKLLDSLATQLKEVEQEIKKHLAAFSCFRDDLTLLSSIVGIQVITASKLLAELPDLALYRSAKAAAADAGLTASRYESGTSVRRRSRLSKVGKAGVRAALYFPAITAMNHCPAMKAFAARLSEKGKAKKVVICAVMRKLVHICYGVLKHRTPYDPAKAFRCEATSS